MTLLLRDPDVKAEEPPAATPPEAPVEAPVRACPTCHAPLEEGQDWCLTCGQAQPGRLGFLPGKRATATVLALTTVLVGGAVAASYAALNDQAKPPASTQVAQAPQAQPAAPAAAATPPAADPAATPPATPPADTPPIAPADSTPPASATPKQPSASSPKPVTPAPTATSTPSTSSGNTTSGGSGTSTGTSTTKAETRTTTTPADTAPKPIALDAADVALYDPYGRASASGDPAKAVDGTTSTSFPITVAEGAQQVGAGLVADLGKLRGIRQLQLTTKTPGFRVEIYATDSDELPPDVLDTRWAHIKDVSSVGTSSGGTQTITLGSGTTKYRHFLLWVTTPPKDGSTVRLTELSLLG